MPIEFTIDTDRALVLTSWIGDVADTDLMPAYRRIMESKAFSPGFDEIVDLGGARINGVTSTGMRELADMVDRQLAGCCSGFRTAIVAPGPLPYGVSRQYAVYADPSPEEVRVFRDPAAAVAWIGADAPLLNDRHCG